MSFARRDALTPEALGMIDTIARSGSFAAAAREMGKVPSALTYNVRQLEDALDVLLFDRRSRQARLTAAGEELLNEGRRLLEQVDAVANRVKRVATGWETQLTVAVDGTISRVTLFEICEAFYALPSQGSGPELSGRPHWRTRRHRRQRDIGAVAIEIADLDFGAHVAAQPGEADDEAAGPRGPATRGGVQRPHRVDGELAAACRAREQPRAVQLNRPVAAACDAPEEHLRGRRVEKIIGRAIDDRPQAAPVGLAVEAQQPRQSNQAGAAALNAVSQRSASDGWRNTRTV